jgi:hypothetical protein
MGFSKKAIGDRYTLDVNRYKKRLYLFLNVFLSFATVLFKE